MEVNLCFSSETAESGRFRLLELPPELLKIIRDGANEKISIRGQATDDAVLCTSNKTYQIRSVTLSNSFYVVGPPQAEEEHNVHIRDTVHELLELAPCIPRLHKLDGLLRNSIYDDAADVDSDEESGEDFGRPTKKARYTYDDIKTQLQASDIELDRGLKQRRILKLGRYLRPLSLAYLKSILELTLTTMVSMSLSPEDTPILDIADALESEHELQKDVVIQVMSWFGEMSSPIIDGSTKWKMDTRATVKQIGLGILANYKDDPVTEDELFEKWRTAVGDAFENHVDLSLLEGNYLLHSSMSAPTTISYFPASSLPITPSERFRELFLTRIQWSAKDISPFLVDIAVDDKSRDKLLMQYTRQTTDKDGMKWYSAKGGLV